MKSIYLAILTVLVISLTGCLKDDADGSALFPAGPATGSGGAGACASSIPGGTDASMTACPTASGLWTRYEYVVDKTGNSAPYHQFICNVDPADVPMNRAEFEDYSNSSLAEFGQGTNCISATVDNVNANAKLLFERTP